MEYAALTLSNQEVLLLLHYIFAVRCGEIWPLKCWPVVDLLWMDFFLFVCGS